MAERMPRADDVSRLRPLLDKGVSALFLNEGKKNNDFIKTDSKCKTSKSFAAYYLH
jgi:hypothetical protein